ncbi:putative phosphatidylserine decarboxylase [Hypoxylon rubiginosum]|uniref:Phosphatidylserine decarboxylase n=1 Tax=Hypoxylon rubiginosum TaxID=110542 RepID=A0ACC0CTG6_9PEZI|nr:putative phosphatidylserine decarboxylase [Hypoxylon rubiginosum]
MYQPIVQELVGQIRSKPQWREKFELAVKAAAERAPGDMPGISALGDFYKFIDALLKWAPFEGPGGREIHHKLCIFYFVFGQDAVYDLQTPILPEQAGKELSWLSDWLVRYARTMGTFLDSPASLTPETLATFRAAPNYRMEHYLEPRGGWKTFNHFFARNTKPGYRAIANIDDARTIVSPADSAYENKWPVDEDSCVDIKGLKWPISELLKDSEYDDKFKGGIFMHSFLGPNDYHRVHAPVGGKVLEARLIKGQVYFEVTVDNEGQLHSCRKTLSSSNTAGYQFCQMRGLLVLETKIGLVAVLPIGMAQVSSVILTAEKGRTLFKGEEVAYFQFGGSDVVMVFQASSNVQFTATPGVHYDMGETIATAGV